MDNLIQNGTEIRLVSNPVVKGFTLSVCISGLKMDIVEYRIVIWNGTERKDLWVYAREIELIPEYRPAGFNRKVNLNNNNIISNE